jgi:hypothetical protein
MEQKAFIIISRMGLSESEVQQIIEQNTYFNKDSIQDSEVYLVSSGMKWKEINQTLRDAYKDSKQVNRYHHNDLKVDSIFKLDVLARCHIIEKGIRENYEVNLIEESYGFPSPYEEMKVDSSPE